MTVRVVAGLGFSYLAILEMCYVLIEGYDFVALRLILALEGHFVQGVHDQSVDLGVF